MKRRRDNDKRCDACGQTITNPYGNVRLCDDCISRIREAIKPENHKDGICPICGGVVEPSKYNKAKRFCSSRCTSLARRVMTMDYNAAHPRVYTEEQREKNREAKRKPEPRKCDNHHLDKMVEKARLAHMSYGKYVAVQRMVKANV